MLSKNSWQIRLKIAVYTAKTLNKIKMAKNKNRHDSMQEVEEALTKTEQFLENHLNLVIYVIIGVIVVVLGVIGVQKLYIAPNNEEAQEQMFPAQNYFSVDSFDLAINGDGMSLGFLDIIDQYGSTQAAKLAKYYTGVSYLHLGEYELAIDYLKGYKTDDILLAPVSKSAIGDAYVELGEYQKAISAYKKGISISDNAFSAPVIMRKLALTYEKQGDLEKAISTLKKIMTEYPKNPDAVEVEKDIARLEQEL